MKDKTFDVAIIGGGPIGIFTAYYAAMRGLDAVLVEGMPNLGGQPRNLYAQKKIYDVAGKFGITGQGLIDDLTHTGTKIQYAKQLNTIVNNIVKQDDIYQLVTNHQDIFAKAVIITVGNGPFKPRKLAFDYDPKIEGHQLDYFVQDINSYHNKTVLIAGGGDTAVDWALTISKIAHKTFLLHRRDQFRALESSVQALKESTIQLLTPKIITDLVVADNQQLIVSYKEVGQNQVETVTVDKLLVNYGIMSDSRLLRNWELKLQGPFIQVDSKMQTNRPNIYAAGDVVSYPGKKRLITLGFSEGTIAVNSAVEAINPNNSRLMHSSSMFN